MDYGVVYIDACKAKDIGGKVAFAFEEAASIYKKMQVVEKITHRILVALQGKFNNTMK
jgi:hypothetical protein